MSDRPRLSVFRSNKHIWAQLIDDGAGKTIVAAGDIEIKSKIPARGKRVERPKGRRAAMAEKIGELLAERASKKKIATATFDRGGYKYHGIIKAVAEGARKGGLKL